jgi:ATP-dependent Lhr-like helicase
MDVFQCLSPRIKKAIWDLKWPALRPIQEAAVPAILHTDDHLILSASTASGKTEAAFLPILSKIEDQVQTRLSVLYVAPLKAFINDQFDRIEKLCEYIGADVHKWHGDVTGHAKKKFIQNPKGILQITPESLESLFINRTHYLTSLWSGLSFIVIDEIHAFIGTERGAQLRSLLYRVQEYCNTPVRIIGLSATILDPEGKTNAWIDPGQPGRVTLIRTNDRDKDIFYALHHMPGGEHGKLSLEVLEDVRVLTKDYSSMIFCNDRGLVEETAVLLNRLVQQDGGHTKYLVHHSSIDKSEREYVEEKLKNSNHPISVVCTSTLELGIDIGRMDMVVQIDSTFSVASLKQRIGRTGRREGMPQILQMYTTKKEHLLHAIAVTELFLEAWVEPPGQYALPLDVLFHQLLSTCCQHNGLNISEVFEHVMNNPSFQSICPKHIEHLLHHMTDNGFLELVPGTQEFIVGLEGERILRSKEFYSVFMVNEEFEVYHGAKRIGAVDKTPAVQVGNNIILSGRLWTIDSIENKRDKIYVMPAADAKRPIFIGSGAPVHRVIAEKMQSILCSSQIYSYVNETASEELSEMRRIYKENRITEGERVVQQNEKEVVIELFAGTKISNTLMWMFRSVGCKEVRTNSVGHIIAHVGDRNILSLIDDIKGNLWEPERLIEVTLTQEFMRTKYSYFLSQELQQELHVSGMVDIEGTNDFLNKILFCIITV